MGARSSIAPTGATGVAVGGLLGTVGIDVAVAVDVGSSGVAVAAGVSVGAGVGLEVGVGVFGGKGVGVSVGSGVLVSVTSTTIPGGVLVAGDELKIRGGHRANG